MTWKEFIDSDYNKIQKDYVGDDGDYIEGQFIVITNADDEELVFFVGKLYDHYYGYDPESKTLNVYDGSLRVSANDIIKNSSYSSVYPSNAGGSN